MLALTRKNGGPLTREITPRDFVARGCAVRPSVGRDDLGAPPKPVRIKKSGDNIQLSPDT